MGDHAPSVPCRQPYESRATISRMWPIQRRSNPACADMGSTPRQTVRIRKHDSHMHCRVPVPWAHISVILHPRRQYLQSQNHGQTGPPCLWSETKNVNTGFYMLWTRQCLDKREGGSNPEQLETALGGPAFFSFHCPVE